MVTFLVWKAGISQDQRKTMSKAFACNSDLFPWKIICRGPWKGFSSSKKESNLKCWTYVVAAENLPISDSWLFILLACEISTWTPSEGYIFPPQLKKEKWWSRLIEATCRQDTLVHFERVLQGYFKTKNRSWVQGRRLKPKVSKGADRKWIFVGNKYAKKLKAKVKMTLHWLVLSLEFFTSVFSLLDLSFQTAARILTAPPVDALMVMKDLSQNFPTKAR